MGAVGALRPPFCGPCCCLDRGVLALLVFYGSVASYQLWALGDGHVYFTKEEGAAWQQRWAYTLTVLSSLWPSYFLGLLQPTCTAFVNKGVRNDHLVGSARTGVVGTCSGSPILLLLILALSSSGLFLDNQIINQAAGRVWSGQLEMMLRFWKQKWNASQITLTRHAFSLDKSYGERKRGTALK